MPPVTFHLALFALPVAIIALAFLLAAQDRRRRGRQRRARSRAYGEEP